MDEVNTKREIMYQVLDKVEKRANRATLHSENLDIGPNATALDLLQAVYRNPGQELHIRMRAAMAAIAYETPKLAVTAQVTEQDFATLLDRRLKRLEELKLIEANNAKLIEAQPINGKPPEVGTKPQIETKPPLARTPDRRFRRF